MDNLKKRLKEKGWPSKDINKTVKIVEEAKKKKHAVFGIFDVTVFWTALIVTILGNLIISIALVPSLIALSSVPLFLVIIVLGLKFGFLFEILIRSIGHLEAKHHIFLGILIPIIAVINFFNITIISNNLGKIFRIDNPHNPYLIGIVYTISFILPYAIYKWILKKDYYSD
jgi:hypothetical protein